MRELEFNGARTYYPAIVSCHNYPAIQGAPREAAQLTLLPDQSPLAWLHCPGVPPKHARELQSFPVVTPT